MAMGRNMRNLQDLKAMRGGSEGEEVSVLRTMCVVYSEATTLCARKC